MNWINYDPNGKPDIPESCFEQAEKTGRSIIHVVCHENDPDDPSFNGVSFVTLVDVTPRIGEKIIIEDNTVCEVLDVLHQQVVKRQNGDITSVLLVANIIAMFIGKAQ